MKTILITGASRGLGKEIAAEFSKNKWNVCLNYDSNHDIAKKTSKEINGYLFPCDVSDRNAVKNMFIGIKKQFDELDLVINNAAINKNQLLLKTSAEDWSKIINVNLTGVFNVCKNAVKLMRNNGGHIINISSFSGLAGRAGQCHYSASKAGLIGFSKALAREVSKRNIKVNVILPGYMKTDMLSDDIIEIAKEENILGMINKPIDIAKFIFQLVQTDFISGQVFNLDSRVVATDCTD